MVEVETQFQGWAHEDANVFSNIDRVLRAAGFSLWTSRSIRMSRADLPGRFVFQFPAQTHTGQVTSPIRSSFATWRIRLIRRCGTTSLHRRRLSSWLHSSIFLAFRIVAAELIRAFPSFLPPDASTELLDLLVQSAGEQGPYDSFISRFEANPRDWMPAPIVEVVSEAPAPSLEITPPAPEPTTGSRGSRHGTTADASRNASSA